MIRKAGIKDAGDIHKLIDYYAKKNLMLQRSLNDICENIRDFWVYDDGRVSGCVALHVYSDKLAEIRSLAVDNLRKNRGIGGSLLRACLREAKGLKLSKAFVLTLSPEFFEKFGFKPIVKSKLPQKIWGDCIVCSKYAKCDEVAYIKRL